MESRPRSGESELLFRCRASAAVPGFPWIRTGEAPPGCVHLSVIRWYGGISMRKSSWYWILRYWINVSWCCPCYICLSFLFWGQGSSLNCVYCAWHYGAVIQASNITTANTNQQQQNAKLRFLPSVFFFSWQLLHFKHYPREGIYIHTDADYMSCSTSVARARETST